MALSPSWKYPAGFEAPKGSESYARFLCWALGTILRGDVRGVPRPARALPAGAVAERWQYVRASRLLTQLGHGWGRGKAETLE
jgi:hypothetical protein